MFIEVTLDNSERVCVELKFLSDSSGEQKMERHVSDDALILCCYNFNDKGTGLSRPASIATLDDGKEIYLMFWSERKGTKEPKTRNVQYTLFCSA